MPGRTVTIVVVLLAAGLALAAIHASQLRGERNAALTTLAEAHASASTTGESLSRYQRLSNHRKAVVDGLREQVRWDRSHLVDCWTALIRAVPGHRMRLIFDGPLGYLADAARAGGRIGRYVRRCASDAVP